MKFSTFPDYGIHVPAGRCGHDVRCHCPQCEHQHNNRSKTLSVDTERRLFNCFRCGWSGRIGSGADSKIIPLDPVRAAAEEKKKLEKADRSKHILKVVYSGSYPVTQGEAQPAIDYLVNRLGGHPLPGIPNDLRYHPHLKYFDTETNTEIGLFPTMLAVIRGVDGNPITMHRTYITKDGRKADVNSPKKLMSAPWPKTYLGGAVRLYEATDTVIITEGIETALALCIALEEPTWSTICAGGMERVQLPGDVKTVIIGGDNDSNGRGQKAAEVLKKRLISEGRRVKVMTPNKTGQDWLDVLLEE